MKIDALGNFVNASIGAIVKCLDLPQTNFLVQVTFAK